MLRRRPERRDSGQASSASSSSISFVDLLSFPPRRCSRGRGWPREPITPHPAPSLTHLHRRFLEVRKQRKGPGKFRQRWTNRPQPRRRGQLLLPRPPSLALALPRPPSLSLALPRSPSLSSPTSTGGCVEWKGGGASLSNPRRLEAMRAAQQRAA